MYIKNVNEIPSFTAGDDTQLKEVWHPKNDPLSLDYSLAHARLDPGESSKPHLLHHASEMYIFIQGVGRVFIGEESQIVGRGDCVLVPKGCLQHVSNEGPDPLLFYCIVSPPWQASEESIMAE